MAQAQAQPPPWHAPGGGFRNPWPSARDKSLAEVAGMLIGARKWEARPEPMPRADPDWEALARPPGGEGAVTATFVGHATLVVQLGGLTVVTDPIFSQRCSPVQFAGPKRFTPPAFDVSRLLELPRIDAVLLSHNHYDHLDLASVRALAHLPWFVPLGVAAWMRAAGVERVVELDWWGEAPLGDGAASVVCLPCQHFSGRTPLDRNQTLWASWAVLTPQARFYFGGDTGYRSVPAGDLSREEREALPFCPAFAEIGERHGPFDLAALPIGAYNPRDFMSSVHCDPVDAVAVHRDVRARRSVGIHFGTFILTGEPVTEPPRLLREECDRLGIPEDEFFVLAVGETRSLSSPAIESTGHCRQCLDTRTEEE